MPNVTSVWDFSPGDTLTAAKLDDVNCGIHVFSGTATRDAAYGGSGERTLAEGEFAYLADTNTTQYYDGAAWQTVGGGLTLVKTQTIGSAVSSVTVSDVFSATYDAYEVIVSGGASSTNNELNLTFGATSANYKYSSVATNFGASFVGGGSTSTSSIPLVGSGTTTSISLSMRIVNPFLAEQTMVSSNLWFDNSNMGSVRGILNDTTSYTAFTLTTNTGTLTGGTIRVYGYQNS